VPTTIDERLPALTTEIDRWMRPYVERGLGPTSPFYQMMAYHLGWLDAEGAPLESPAIGKRIRPALVVLTCEALGGTMDAARGPAVAVELIHNFSLVHDDIQDRSDQRHGRDTVWKLWGGAQGINVGDAIFALAQVALAEHSAEHPRVADGFLRLNQTCVRLCEGQYLDLALESAANASFEVYEAMIARKTAALIECSTALGAWAAGAAPAVVEACGRFGFELGIAYQFQDDLLGVWGDPAITGKPNRADVLSRKKVLPMMLTLQMAAGRDRDDLLAVLTAPDEPDAATAEQVVGIMERAGVREHAAELVGLRFDSLDEAIRAALPEPARGPILDLCGRLRIRDY
jgi:geranylgeranyl diphosphate synthase type I